MLAATTPTPINGALQTALVDAGVAKLPTNSERVWRAIKESMPDGITHAQLKRRLSAINEGSIGSSLAKLKEQGLVYTRTTKAPAGNWRDAVLQYLTDADTYTPPRRGRVPGTNSAPKVKPAAAAVTQPKPAQEPLGADAKFATLYATNYSQLVTALVRAGGAPELLQTATLAEFLVKAAKNGIKLSAEV